jgi:hypothetical protein
MVPNRVELTFLCLEFYRGCQDVKKLVASCLSLFPAHWQSRSENPSLTDHPGPDSDAPPGSALRLPGRYSSC